MLLQPWERSFRSTRAGGNAPHKLSRSVIGTKNPGSTQQAKEAERTQDKPEAQKPEAKVKA
eukprot:scaffold952_cov249-Pinguiococcus_pyrenoidosus.AAC.35